jgi:hypothetical protein
MATTRFSPPLNASRSMIRAQTDDLPEAVPPATPITNGQEFMAFYWIGLWPKIN